MASSKNTPEQNAEVDQMVADRAHLEGVFAESFPALAEIVKAAAAS